MTRILSILILMCIGVVPVAHADSSAKSAYTALLRQTGKPCTVSAYKIIGTQKATGRDWVEFQCPEQPAGLIGFVPRQGTASASDLHDCFLDQIRQQSCTLTTSAILENQVEQLIEKTDPKASCDIAHISWTGEDPAVKEAVTAEVACSDQRHYAISIAPDRQSLAHLQPIAPK